MSPQIFPHNTPIWRDNQHDSFSELKVLNFPSFISHFCQLESILHSLCTSIYEYLLQTEYLCVSQTHFEIPTTRMRECEGDLFEGLDHEGRVFVIGIGAPLKETLESNRAFFLHARAAVSC